VAKNKVRSHACATLDAHAAATNFIWRERTLFSRAAVRAADARFRREAQKQVRGG
jgi:hypothetical protein